MPSWKEEGNFDPEALNSDTWVNKIAIYASSSIFGWENVFFLSILLRLLRQGICSSINLALPIIDPAVILSKLLSPTDLL